MELLLETNFLIELVFGQEQAIACETLLRAAESNSLTIHIPAFSLMEQVYRLAGANKKRLNMQAKVQQELIQAQRETTEKAGISSLERDFNTLLEIRSQQQQERLLELSQRVSKVTQVVPLSTAVWVRAAELAEEVELTLPDCIVCASLLERVDDLGVVPPKLFVTRDKKAFRQPAVKQLFEDQGCEVLLSFEHVVQKLRLV